MSSHLLQDSAPDIPLDAVVSPVQEQVFSELDGEAVVLQLASGVYYGLNDVGARIWDLIQKKYTVETLHTKLCDEYEVAPEVCRQDLLTVLTDLKRANLIEIVNVSA